MKTPCCEPGCTAEVLCAVHEYKKAVVKYLVDMGYEDAAFLLTSGECDD